jgi:hypothetical protein
MARVTGLEPAASCVTGRRSNQLSYTRAFDLITEFEDFIIQFCFTRNRLIPNYR